MERTITVRLAPCPAISATIWQFNEATNYFLRAGYENNTHSKKILQSLAYRDVRKGWPCLQSSLVQGARDCAADMLRREKGKRLPVKRQGSSARYNQRTFKAYLNSGHLSLSTVEGRLKIPIRLPDYFLKYTDAEVVSLRLREIDRVLQADIVVRLPDNPATPVSVTPRVIGMDRGIVNIAVTSDNRFYNSRTLRNVRGRYSHLRGRLQSAGTRSAKRHLKRLSGRERRFQRNCNHVISKEVAALDFNVLAIEELSVRKDRKKGRRFNRMLGGWSYAQLESFLRYKCEAAGKSVVTVNPAYTSQDCSRCGVRGKRNGSAFTCLFCGFSLNADLNAARNIADRGMSPAGRPHVNGPIVAGMRHRAEPCADHSYKPPVLTGGS